MLNKLIVYCCLWVIMFYAKQNRVDSRELAFERFRFQSMGSSKVHYRFVGLLCRQCNSLHQNPVNFGLKVPNLLLVHRFSGYKCILVT